MKESGDEDAVFFNSVEDDVLLFLKAMQTGTNPVTRAAKGGIGREEIGALLKDGEVAVGLCTAPGFQGEGTNVEQVGFGAAGETCDGHN